MEIKMNKIEANTFVMNNQTGKAYMVTTDTVQSRNRRELLGTELRNPEITQYAESHLSSICTGAAMVCHEAERILRWKKKQTPADKQILIMYRALRNSIIK